MSKEKNNPLSDLTEEMLFEGLAQASQNIYLFKVDVEKDYSVWSENAIKYFGFPDDYSDHCTALWMEHIHPDDRKSYEEDISALFSGKKVHHYCQYRAKNAQGKYVWLECNGSLIQDEKTKKQFFIGLINRLDITGRYDVVTNCINFKAFYQTHYHGTFVLLLLGIDRFRQVINQIGFTESNQILACLGSVLQEKSSKDSVFRMTGDEFIVILPGQSMEEVTFFFDQVQAEFQKRVMEREKGIHVTFSGGATYYDASADDKEDVLQRLEHCLDYSKQQGLATLTKYSAIVDEKRVYMMKLQTALTEAIANNFEGFRLVFQPVVTSMLQKIDGVEALLRFYNKELGVVSPADFIPLLEGNGEIVPVGRWVAETAIRQKAEWDKIHPGLRVGFNVSMVQLRDRSLTDYIVELVKKYKIRPDEIIVELTESRKLGDPELMREVLAPLNEIGVWVFLDDFGMEASNFVLVKELEVNGIKIDHSFVRTMADANSERESRVNTAIVSSIAYLAKTLDMRVIVEGVENAAIDEMIYNMNIHYTQGYYYSKPITAEELEANWIGKGSARRRHIYIDDHDEGNYPRLTHTELEMLMKQLSKIFDVVRVVDVGMMRVLTYADNGIRQVTEQACYEVWGKEGRCKNCTSAMAFREKNRMTKFEFIDHEIYHVTSQYLVANGEPCILELVEKHSDQALLGSFGQNQLVDRIKAYSNEIYTDELTDVNNRKYFDEQILSLEMDAVAMLDIDHFHRINERYSSKYGDQVLAAVAKEIIRNVRSEDCVVRYGGDVFLIGFSLMKEDGLAGRLEMIRSAIEEMVVTDQNLRVTVSIGSAQGRGFVSRLEPLAKAALRDARKTGNTVVIRENH